MTYLVPIDGLKKFVHSTASAGDIAIAYDEMRDRRFWYICTKDNIGEDIEPYWMDERIITKMILENKFGNMTMEEKIDLLMDDYIERKYK